VTNRAQILSVSRLGLLDSVCKFWGRLVDFPGANKKTRTRRFARSFFALWVGILYVSKSGRAAKFFAVRENRAF
jgi:hypothetical protein